MDFNAWFEAFLGGQRYTFDARHNCPRVGRSLIARGRDAADVPMITSFGPHRLGNFTIITEEVQNDRMLAASTHRRCGVTAQKSAISPPKRRAAEMTIFQHRSRNRNLGVFGAFALMAGNNSIRNPFVLVVEDEPLLRLHAVGVLEDAGFVVAEAANAESTVALSPNRISRTSSSGKLASFCKTIDHATAEAKDA
jgi:hypothetical protein